MSSRVSKRITEQEYGQDLFESKREKSLWKGIPRFKEVFTKYKARTRKRAFESLGGSSWRMVESKSRQQDFWT
ncbi:hypothetical protein GmHk_01G001557 [Glycine max]|nr:hypothetical protein GmHk_01G001557 [Glycine max]